MPRVSRRPAITTLHPCSAKSSAVALPIPEAPPVITATLFSNLTYFSYAFGKNLKLCEWSNLTVLTLLDV